MFRVMDRQTIEIEDDLYELTFDVFEHNSKFRSFELMVILSKNDYSVLFYTNTCSNINESINDILKRISKCLYKTNQFENELMTEYIKLNKIIVEAVYE